MTDLAQLVTAFAALITSLGGALAAVIIALRSGARQAKVDPAQVTAMFDLMKKIPGADPKDFLTGAEQDQHESAPEPPPGPPSHP